MADPEKLIGRAFHYGEEGFPDDGDWVVPVAVAFDAVFPARYPVEVVVLAALALQSVDLVLDCFGRNPGALELVAVARRQEDAIVFGADGCEVVVCRGSIGRVNGYELAADYFEGCDSRATGQSGFGMGSSVGSVFFPGGLQFWFPE